MAVKSSLICTNCYEKTLERVGLAFDDAVSLGWSYVSVRPAGIVTIRPRSKRTWTRRTSNTSLMNGRQIHSQARANPTLGLTTGMHIGINNKAPR